MTTRQVFHITTAVEAEAARTQGEYCPAAFAREGFIHCSYAHQVAATANRLFRGRDGLVVLEIDADALTAPVVDENLEGGTELFPHIYGALPLTAIRAVHRLAAGENGLFTLPVIQPPG